MTSIGRRVHRLLNRARAGCLVLCYHRVSDDTSDCWRNAVSVRNFIDHIALLSERYGVLSIDELVDALAHGRPPGRRSIVVTFDDGYAVNRGQACTILVEHRTPATFYLNTAWLSRDRFWWDELVDVVPDEARRLELRGVLKGLNDDARAETLRQLASSNGAAHAARIDCAPMTATDLQAIASERLFTVGGHTHSHPALSCLPPDRQRAELVENKRILEEITGRAVTHFAYPFGGAEDFDQTTVEALREAGFSSAATTDRRPARWPGDVYRIPRLSVKNWDVRKFEAELSDVWAN